MKSILSLLFLYSLNVIAVDDFLVRTITEANRVLVDVQATSNTADLACVQLDGRSLADGVRAFPNLRTVNSCFRPRRDPLPFRGLGVGEQMVMKHDIYDRTEGPLRGTDRGNMTGNYLLRRTTQRNYQVVLNVNFPESQNSTYMFQKTRDCMREIGPSMFGPGNEQMEIVVLNSAETAALPSSIPKPDPITINVAREAPDFRGDANNFGTGFTCATIAHEMFHHLGLVDEYAEQDRNDISSACRTITSQTSMMRNKDVAFDATVPQVARCSCGPACVSAMNNPRQREILLSMNAHDIIRSENSVEGYCVESAGRFETPETASPRAFQFLSKSANQWAFESRRVVDSNNTSAVEVKTYTCTCPPGIEYCPRIMNHFERMAGANISRARCPYISTPVTTDASIAARPVSASQVIEVGGQNFLEVRSRGSDQPLLSSSQFYKILSGNCAGGSPNYEACAAYSMAESGTSCASVPPECRDDNFYLNGPQGASDQTSRSGQRR